MSAVTPGSAVTPVNPWRFGAVWTIFFLAFPVAFTAWVDDDILAHVVDSPPARAQGIPFPR
jgi:hypothetical protein